MRKFSTMLLIAILTSIALASLNFDTSTHATMFVEEPATITPWPMFRHDSEHTGHSTSSVPSTANSIWSFTTHGLGRVTSSPTVANDRVFIGSDNYKVYALNQSTGVEIWNYTTAAEVHSSPAIEDGRVFVGSYDGNLYALYESTGMLNWSRKLVDGIVYASPTVVYDKVFVTAFQTSGNHEGYIYALNKTTGSTLWAKKISLNGRTENVYVHSSPAVVGGLVFFGAHSQSGYYGYYGSIVFAVSVTDGHQQWETSIGGGNGIYLFSSPSVIPGSMVFIGNDDGYVSCLDYNSGSLLWKNSTGGAVRSSPAIADGKVFVGSNDGKVYAFDMWSGNQVWNYTTGGPVLSSPAVADGKVTVGSDDGYLYVLNENTGTLIWKSSLGGFVESSPSVADGLIIIGSHAGKVEAFGPHVKILETAAFFNLSPNPIAVGGTLSLRGFLFDEYYHPVSYDSVKIYARPLSGSWQLVTSVPTDAKGFFKWQVTIPGAVTPGTYIFAVYYSGSARHKSTYSLAALVIQ